MIKFKRYLTLNTQKSIRTTLESLYSSGKDLSDLKNQIEWARHNKDKAAKIGANGRRFALDNLSPMAVEQAATNKILAVSKSYRKDANIRGLTRRTSVKVCALSASEWICAKKCPNCPQCKMYDF